MCVCVCTCAHGHVSGFVGASACVAICICVKLKLEKFLEKLGILLSKCVHVSDYVAVYSSISCPMSYGKLVANDKLKGMGQEADIAFLKLTPGICL